MQNLAGHPNCDSYIAEELQKAGVEIVRHNERSPSNEVPALLTGQLKIGRKVLFTFVRRWYYWEVTGPVPLGVAQTLYMGNLGRWDIRVNGQDDRPPPVDMVKLYHIDSQDGLNLFVDTVKTYYYIMD